MDSTSLSLGGVVGTNTSGSPITWIGDASRPATISRANERALRTAQAGNWMRGSVFGGILLSSKSITAPRVIQR